MGLLSEIVEQVMESLLNEDRGRDVNGTHWRIFCDAKDDNGNVGKPIDIPYSTLKDNSEEAEKEFQIYCRLRSNSCYQAYKLGFGNRFRIIQSAKLELKNAELKNDDNAKYAAKEKLMAARIKFLEDKSFYESCSKDVGWFPLIVKDIDGEDVIVKAQLTIRDHDVKSREWNLNHVPFAVALIYKNNTTCTNTPTGYKYRSEAYQFDVTVNDFEKVKKIINMTKQQIRPISINDIEKTLGRRCSKINNLNPKYNQIDPEMILSSESLKEKEALAAAKSHRTVRKKDLETNFNINGITKEVDGKKWYCTNVNGLPLMWTDEDNVAYQPIKNKFAKGPNTTNPLEIIESKIYKNMEKKVQRINESQLRAIVTECVKEVLTLCERYDDYDLPVTVPSPRYPYPTRSIEDQEKELNNFHPNYDYSKEWHAYCKKRKAKKRMAGQNK